MKITKYDYLLCKLILDIFQPVLSIILYLLLVSILPIIQNEYIAIQFPSAPNRGCPARTVAGGRRFTRKNMVEIENVSEFINH
ncbi:hypothetical protein WJM97_15710 [Okeanomitos corallinicola TIOX110]|uniref:Uncharacterized protein n=1 Tax=Okeanomitos corallinicola TIOX110 TaxID=3133117 RepID=A0ABZ2UP91_9CYAN